jgi:hypothetical protein
MKASVTSVKKNQTENQFTYYLITIKRAIPYFLMFLYLVSSYNACYYFLQKIEKKVNSVLWTFIYLLFFYSVGIIISYGFYIILYMLDTPYIQQFRTIDMPLPWKENPEFWKEIKPKLIKLNVKSTFFYNPKMFNILVIGPSTLFIILYFYRPRSDISSSPSA